MDLDRGRARLGYLPSLRLGDMAYPARHPTCRAEHAVLLYFVPGLTRLDRAACALVRGEGGRTPRCKREGPAADASFALPSPAWVLRSSAYASGYRELPAAFEDFRACQQATRCSYSAVSDTRQSRSLLARFTLSKAAGGFSSTNFNCLGSQLNLCSSSSNSVVIVCRSLLVRSVQYDSSDSDRCWRARVPAYVAAPCCKERSGQSLLPPNASTCRHLSLFTLGSQPEERPNSRASSLHAHGT